MAKDSCSVITYDGLSYDWVHCSKDRDQSFSVSSYGNFGAAPQKPASVQSDDTAVSGHPVIDSSETYASDAAAYSKEINSKISERITLAMPASKILFRTIRIPSTDPDEINSIVANQVEKDSPLPPEETVYSFETLFSSDAETVVLIAFAPSAAIEDAGDLISGGIGKAKPERIERVDARILGILQNIADEKIISGDGRRVCLVSEGAETVLVVMNGTAPAIIRTVNGGDTSLLRRILKVSLIQAEANFGPSEILETLCIEDGDAIFSGISDTAASMEFPLKKVSLGALPPAGLGCAKRTLLGKRLNLFPNLWKTELNNRRFKRRRTGVIVGFAAFWAILMAWLYGWPAVLDGRAAALTAESARIAPRSDAVRDLRTRIDIINRYSDRRFSPLEAMYEITMALPPGIELSAFRYRGTEKRVQVEGRADNPTYIYDFMNRLDMSPLFDGNQLVSGPTLNRQLGKNVFELNVIFGGARTGEKE